MSEFIDLITVSTEEREKARVQVLMQMRIRYLTFKAEWLTNQAIGEPAKVDYFYKKMSDIALAYEKVNDEL